MNDPSFLLRFSRTLTVGAAAFLGAAGCAPSFGGAVGAYEHGRYPEAMEELRAVETEAHRWDPSDAARYALYRGLAHFALGELPASHFWLARVKQGLDIHPALLSADDAGRLASAWAHLPR